MSLKRKGHVLVLWSTDHTSRGLWSIWHLERQNCRLSFLIIQNKGLYKTSKCLVCEKITCIIIYTAVSYDQNCLSWMCQQSPCVSIWIDNNPFDNHKQVSKPTYLLEIDTYMKKNLKYVSTNVISLFEYRRNTERAGTMKLICKSLNHHLKEVIKYYFKPQWE